MKNAMIKTPANLSEEEKALFEKSKLIIENEALPISKKVEAAYEAISKIGHKGYDLLLGLYLRNDADLSALNTKEFFLILEEGYKEGNTQCAFLLGLLNRGRGDFIKAKECFEFSKDINDPDALYFYGLTYIEKEYGQIDYEKGRNILELAASRGSAKAELDLGLHYLNGIEYAEGMQDVSKGYEHISNADTLGEEGCLYYLGTIALGVYENTPENLIDDMLGRELIEEAARRGEAKAIRHVGTFYETGAYDYKADPFLAYSFFKRAAFGGDLVGAYFAASMVYNGEMEDDPREAVVLLTYIINSDDATLRAKAHDMLVKILDKTHFHNSATVDEIANMDVEALADPIERAEAFEKIKDLLEDEKVIEKITKA